MNRMIAKTMPERILTPIQSAPRRPPGIARLLELRIGAGDDTALVAAPAEPAEALDERPHRPLVEGLLQLVLLQRLRLHDELREARLDGVLTGSRGHAIRDEQDREGGDNGDEDLGLHGDQTLMSTMRRMNR